MWHRFLLPVLLAILATAGTACNDSSLAPPEEGPRPEKDFVEEPEVAESDRPQDELGEREQYHENGFVPEDTCILDLQLPADVAVRIDGHDVTTPSYSFENLTADRTHLAKVQLTYPDAQSDRTVLLKPGGRVRLVSLPAVSSLPELALQQGHSSMVLCAAISPDGRHAVTTSADGTARLWDVASGVEIRRFEGAGLWAKSIAFSPDGRQVLTGCQDGVVRMWATQTGELVRRLEGHSLPVNSVVFSHDGRKMLSGSSDSTVRLWDRYTGAEIRQFTGHSQSVFSVAFSQDDAYVLSGGQDKTARLWSTATGTEISRFSGHENWVTSVAFSPDGRQVLTGVGCVTGLDGKSQPTVTDTPSVARLWDVATGKEIRQFEGHSASIFSVAFSPNGKYVLTGGGSFWSNQDLSARLWNRHTGEEIHRLQHRWIVFSVSFSPDGQRILTASFDGTAGLWDTTTGKQIRRLESRLGTILAFSPDDRRIIAANSHLGYAADDHDFSIWLLDSRTWQEVCRMSGHTSTLFQVAVSSDLRKVVSGSNDRTARLWDARSGEQLLQFEGHDGPIVSVAFSSDDRIVLTSSMDGTARLWNAHTGAEMCSLEGHSGDGRLLPSFDGQGLQVVAALSHNGRMAATGASNGSVRLWDVVSGDEIRQFDGTSSVIWAVAFSPDDKLLVTSEGWLDTLGARDLATRLWDVQTGQEIRQLEGHSSVVSSVAFSSDGNLLLTASLDKTARLWDVQTGSEIHRFEGHAGAVTYATFSANEEQVFSWSIDGTVRIWCRASGDELLRVVGMPDGKGLLAVTPEGLFDGSQLGREMVHFRMPDGLTVVPVDRFFRDCYYPGLLTEILAGKRPFPGTTLGRNPAPELQILLRDTPQRAGSQITLDVVVSDRGGGLQEPWLFHNNSRAGKPENVGTEDETIRCEFRVSLVEGENRISVHSASGDGSWEAEPALLTLDYQGSLPKPDLYVLAIGIDEFQGTRNLKGCAGGARAMVNLFQSRHASQYGNVRVGSLHGNQATRERILDYVRVLAGKAKPQDTIVVYAASHGWTIGQRYYLLPHEFKQSEGQTTNEAVRQWGLPIDELGNALSQVPALKRVLIFDTCQSGSAVKSQRSPFEFRGAVERFSRSQGIFCLAASAEDANAFEHPKTAGMGILTFTLLAGMGLTEDEHGLLGGAHLETTSAEGEVDVIDWFRFAERHVPRLYEELTGQKKHYVEMRGQEPSFAVLRQTP